MLGYTSWNGSNSSLSPVVNEIRGLVNIYRTQKKENFFKNQLIDPYLYIVYIFPSVMNTCDLYFSVTLRPQEGREDAYPYKGFMIQARRPDSLDAMGTFIAYDESK